MATVTSDMTIMEVLQMDEGVAPIFTKHGMHCLGCPAAAGESLEQACAGHDIDPNKLVDELNRYFENAE